MRNMNARIEDDYGTDSDNRDQIAELEQAKQDLIESADQLLSQTSAERSENLTVVGRELLEYASSLKEIEDQIRRMGG